MKVLFLHNNFPAQFRHLAQHLVGTNEWEVAFGTNREEGQISGVLKALYAPHRKVNPEIHPYLATYEEAVLNGQAVFRSSLKLSQAGFKPDVVVAHSGWGPGLYIPEAFPDAKLVTYLEWYYWALGSNNDFLPDHAPTEDGQLRIRTSNLPFLLDLAHSHWSLTPTVNQLDQIPEFFHERISTIHDGVDTNFFSPSDRARVPVEGIPEGAPIVTYATRGMEPYRGFPQFMRAAKMVQDLRPDAHIVIAGTDRVAYGRALEEGDSWKQRMLAECDFDPSRIHFTGSLPYNQYRALLRSSTVHCYLTIPFVLSWGMIEAMSVGCLIVASDTAPVQEMITDGYNGLLVDFFDHEALAHRLVYGIENQIELASLRHEARQTVIDGYELSNQLEAQVQMLTDLAQDRTPELHR